MFSNYIAHIALLVKDYDEALAFFCRKLGFELLEDTPLTATKRWVLVVPKGGSQTALLLARAEGAQQLSVVGNQFGGRVGFFLFTDNLKRDYDVFREQGVVFVRTPQEATYGKVAVFQDLYGNLWDLLEPSPQNKGLRRN